MVDSVPPNIPGPACPPGPNTDGPSPFADGGVSASTHSFARARTIATTEAKQKAEGRQL